MPKETKITEYSFMLKASTIEGVGLFATHDIAKETLLVIESSHNEKIRNREEVPDFFKRYCICDQKMECTCPEDPRVMNIWWFINHSQSPNVHFRKEDRAMIAARDIKAGEELFINYNLFEEPEEVREDHVKRK